MHRLLLILCVAGLATGCASRLPVGADAPVARVAAEPPAWSADAFRTTVDHLRDRESCFVRCAAKHEGIVEEAAEEEFPLNEIALFLGYTFERGEGGFTIGLDYAYWFNEHVGVGPFADFVFGEIDAFAAGAGVWIRPVPHFADFAVYVAPGIDLANEEEEKEEGGITRTWESAALLRLGAVYAIDMGRGFRLDPSFYIDVIFPDKAAYILGLTFGKEF